MAVYDTIIMDKRGGDEIGRVRGVNAKNNRRAKLLAANIARVGGPGVTGPNAEGEISHCFRGRLISLVTELTPNVSVTPHKPSDLYVVASLVAR